MSNQSDQVPATLDAVVAAVIAVSRFDESEIQQIASEGILQKLFPFKPHAVDFPPDTIPREQLRPASVLPLDHKARKTLIQASVSPRVRLANERAKEFEEFAAEWHVDNSDVPISEAKSPD